MRPCGTDFALFYYLHSNRSRDILWFHVRDIQHVVVLRHFHSGVFASFLWHRNKNPLFCRVSARERLPFIFTGFWKPWEYQIEKPLRR